jgi:serine/threonine protein kinase
LHHKGVSHRDIKLENIIIDKKGVVKLIDFGFCCSSTTDVLLKVFCGTPSYMAPEIVSKLEYYGPPTDIWACGVLLYAMLCGAFPFKGVTDKDLYRKISLGAVVWPDNTKVSKEAQEFVTKLMDVNAKTRLKADKLLK